MYLSNFRLESDEINYNNQQGPFNKPSFKITIFTDPEDVSDTFILLHSLVGGNIEIKEKKGDKI